MHLNHMDLKKNRWIRRLSLLSIMAVILLIGIRGLHLSSQTAHGAPSDGIRNAGVYQFSLGSFKVATLADGALGFPPHPTFAANADPAEVEQVMLERFWSPEELLLYFNATYVDTGEHKVLIDTGAGVELGEGLAQLPDHLRTLGVEPEEIDTVIITHAHLDHIGGIVNADGNLTFANAQYYISDPEWQFWTAPEVDLSPLRVSDEFKASFVAGARKHLMPIADRVTLFGSDQEIVPGIRALAAPGHTPGQAVLQITSENQQLLITADVFFNQAFDLAHPDWQTAFDLDPEAAAATRRRILDQVVEQKTLVLAFHMPFPGLGHIRSREDAYEWEPALWLFSA